MKYVIDLSLSLFSFLHYGLQYQVCFHIHRMFLLTIVQFSLVWACFHVWVWRGRTAGTRWPGNGIQPKAGSLSISFQLLTDIDSQFIISSKTNLLIKIAFINLL